ncbi:protein-L-isoaspartate O-methyltransferase [Candidatus Puniceispirillum sp.]|nr:protein-L-isoaspartate O-methyltransferase [Candidatus Puniceispirillum sp.]
MNELQFETARKMMVDCQIRPSKVTNQKVLDAFLLVPREAFVGKHQRTIAYIDEDLPLPGGRNLMEPMVFARLVQALEVQVGDSVLVVGAASGYGSAIMSHLAGSVIAVETRTQLVEKAQEILVAHGIDNTAVIKSRLVDGYAEEAPYDRILVEGSVETMPATLLEQLTTKGKLAAIYRPHAAPIGTACIWTRSGKSFVRKSLFDACVPNLDDFNKKLEFIF